MTELNEKDLNKVNGGKGNSGETYFRINTDFCVQCEACMSACPTDSIKKGDKCLYIDTNTCIRCGACKGNCPINAIEKVTD